MATPKVFISSTCFDLGEIREQLARFIHSYGFDPILSDHGDVFYKPDCHTHDSCIHEVSNCQLFILIIGGRFGGEYVYDKSKSITNAEYSAARACNIPIFTYVRAGVLSNHHVYQQNRKKEFVASIDYPSIEKQEYAIDIFGFIDDVRRSSTNNSIEGFHNFQGIETNLRKQWAGLFFDLLKSREISSQMNVTNHLISEVKSSNQKLENLLKSFYIASNKAEATKEIAAIETASHIEMFFEKVLRPSWIKGDRYLLDQSKLDIDFVSEISSKKKSWDAYLIETGLFAREMYPEDTNDDDSEMVEGLTCQVTSDRNAYFVIGVNEIEAEGVPVLFEKGVKDSNVEQRKKALTRILEKFGKPTTKRIKENN